MMSLGGSGSKSWGTPQKIGEYALVTGTSEIPPGKTAYVFQKQHLEKVWIWPVDWYNFLSGDLSELKEKIERDIPGTKVLWLKASWDEAVGVGYPCPPVCPIGSQDHWDVYGFYVEALVQNVGGAALTGFEIAAIIVAIAFLTVVVVLCLTGAWVVWEIIEVIPDPLKPVLVPIVGVVILAGIGFLFYNFFTK